MLTEPPNTVKILRNIFEPQEVLAIVTPSTSAYIRELWCKEIIKQQWTDCTIWMYWMTSPSYINIATLIKASC